MEVFFLSSAVAVSSLNPARGGSEGADRRLFSRFFSQRRSVICSDCQCFSRSAPENPFILLRFKMVLLQRHFCVCACINALNTHIHSLLGWSCLLYTLDLSHLAFCFWPVNSNEVTVVLEQRPAELFILQQNQRTGSPLVLLQLSNKPNTLLLVLFLLLNYCTTTFHLFTSTHLWLILRHEWTHEHTEWSWRVQDHIYLSFCFFYFLLQIQRELWDEVLLLWFFSFGIF